MAFGVARILSALLLELRCGWLMPGLPGFDMVCFSGRYPILVLTSALRAPSDAPNNPGLHAAFLFLFVVFMVALLGTVCCDPSKSATQTKDALKFGMCDSLL
jgi:hypothetical protein